jgi:site-specific DNA-methyltransferase (adenine-specific)
MEPITRNTLFYGDNLQVLRDHVPSQSVDLIYLDPPFNSSRNYNVLFKDESGQDSESQIVAFEDTWSWGPSAEATYNELYMHTGGKVGEMISAMRSFIGENPMMAYLVMMAARLVELHRVLKPTGSLYLHCDPTASHYLKVLMDTIFGVRQFRNEIVWKRTNAHNDAHRYGNIHDVLLFYVKDIRQSSFSPVYVNYSEDYLKSEFRQDNDGRWYKVEDLTAPYRGGQGGRFEFHGRTPGPTRMWRLNETEMGRLWKEGRIKTDAAGVPLLRGHIVYLDEKKGMPVQDWWDDILRVGNTSGERMGYPTQKPLALLERIIQASSNEGDVVLDPFCGCGTAIAAAQKLKRRWIGIDVTHLSVALQKYRLRDMFDMKPGQDYNIIGEPSDLGAARQLAEESPYQFQWWACSLIEARPLGGEAGSKKGKKGSDKGIDGIIPFLDEAGGDIRDLRGTVEREKAEIGLFITLHPPSKDMKTEAVSAGYYHSPWTHVDYPKIQILTIDDLLHGKRVEMPPPFNAFKQARRVGPDAPEQHDLGL